MSGLGFSNSGVPVSGGMPYNQDLAQKRSDAYQTLWDLEEHRDVILNDLEVWTSNDTAGQASHLRDEFRNVVTMNLDCLELIEEEIELVEGTIKDLTKVSPVAGSVPPTGLSCG